MVKSLYDISWKVEESEYREDPALSYSTLSTYERVGFNGLSTLADKKESQSLTFGSAVDSIITGGDEEFNSRFLVADFPEISDTMLKIVKRLFDLYKESYSDVSKIPEDQVKVITNELDYGKSWGTQTVFNKVVSSCSDYYRLLYLAGDKTILSSGIYEKVVATVRALRESDATKKYFSDDNPFDDSIKGYYQLKFKATLNGIDYRCMADRIIVDYANKKIWPIDLKTSSHPEWDFYKAFIEWHYQLQARLYWRIIKDNLMRDSYFKDFKLMDYTFIVVNKETLTPLVWEFPLTQSIGTLTVGKNNQVELPDPEDLGKELSNYLNNSPTVPSGINIDKENNLLEWLKNI